VTSIRIEIDESAMGEIVHSTGATEVVSKVAEAMLRAQRSLAPVDTGRLVASLEIRENPDPVEPGAAQGVAVGSFDVAYAAAQELGYHHAGSGRFIPAQPYIRPSMDSGRAVLAE